MSEKPTAPPGFLKAVVGGIVRHSITGAAGAMAAAGMIQTSQEKSFVDIGVSIALWGFGVWWSAIQKKKAAGTASSSDGIY